MTSTHRWLVPLSTSLLLLAGCSSSEPLHFEEVDAPGELVTSSKERVTTPGTPPEDLTELVAGNTDFGAAVYRQVAQPGENLFFSPFSISQGFALVYPGARGNTEAQVAQTLHFSLPPERLHRTMNALDLALQAHAGDARGDEGTPPTFRVVNSAWGQKGLEFEPAYLDVLAVNYGAGMRVVDFQNEADPIRKSINAWVEAQTAGRIKDLLPKDSVQSDTRLVLTNALYFKGSWSSRFFPQSTASAPFHTLEGGTQPVQMMHATGGFERMTGEGFDAVALRYAGRAFRMLVIVPHEGRFAEIESRLSARFLDDIRGALRGGIVDLGFPRFEVKQEFPLAEPLRALGMVDVFTDGADLSGMTRQTALKISAAYHQAFVSVNEEGTEAAAATGDIAVPISVPVPFLVDHPFLFVIEDVETRSVLFLGRIVKP